MEFYEDEAGKHRWRLVGNNHVKVAGASQGFHDEAEAKENARRTHHGLAEWLYQDLKEAIEVSLAPFEGRTLTPALKEEVTDALARLGVVQEVVEDGETAPIKLEDDSG